MGRPTKVSRAAYGPTFKDAKKIANAETDLGAAQFNLLFHQISGMDLITAQAWIAAHWDGAAMVLDAHAESWNPNQIQTTPYDPPVVTRSSTGIYQVQYNAQYPDEKGQLVTIDALYPRGFVTSFTLSTTYIGHVRGLRSDARTIQVRVYEWDVGTSTDWALSDRPFFLAWG